MSTKRFVSVAMWVLGALAMAPAFEGAAQAHGVSDGDAIPLEGSQCWGRCSACTANCGSVYSSGRESCERACEARNSSCCEASGRHGAGRACGCD